MKFPIFYKRNILIVVTLAFEAERVNLAFAYFCACFALLLAISFLSDLCADMFF